MENNTIQLFRDGHLATLTLNRPRKRNALNRQMMKDLIIAIDEVAADDRIRVLLLTGAGEGFCAGADFDIMPGGGDSARLKAMGVDALKNSFLFKAARRIILGLQQMEKPTVAMIDGACVGAGLDLALACDLRVASDRARFTCGFIRLGLFPGFGATWLYPRAVGLGKALELLFTGELISATIAERIGLINRLCTADRLCDETRILIDSIAAGPPIALRMIKAQVYQGLNTNLAAALEKAALCESITLVSEDHIEGVRAFVEKRKPIFQGR
jgi:enoyl-CoA hydratase/carnithine racemase